MDRQKRCCTCHLVLPVTEFNRRAAAVDGLQSRCRACSRSWYVNNRDAHISNVARRNAAYRAVLADLLAAYLGDHPCCVDCGETDIRCLEFDHRDRAAKTANVSALQYQSRSWTVLLREIEKCDVRCANCHRRKTLAEVNSWRHQFFLSVVDAEPCPAADSSRRGENGHVLIRDATDDDWPAIWPFLHEIVAAGETYTYPLDLTEPDARALWMLPPPGRTAVAVDDDGTVLGSAKMNPNHAGNGSHIASASFMVDPARSGRGVGRALGEDMIAWATEAGYRLIQFNAVVESNTRAVALWKSLGFEIIGTLPEGFKSPTHGYVGLHIMYRPLPQPG